MREQPRQRGMSGRDRRLDGFEDDPFSPDWKGRSDGTVGGSGRASRMAGGQPRVVRAQHVRRTTLPYTINRVRWAVGRRLGRG